MPSFRRTQLHSKQLRTKHSGCPKGVIMNLSVQATLPHWHGFLIHCWLVVSKPSQVIHGTHITYLQAPANLFWFIYWLAYIGSRQPQAAGASVEDSACTGWAPDSVPHVPWWRHGPHWAKPAPLEPPPVVRNGELRLCASWEGGPVAMEISKFWISIWSVSSENNNIAVGSELESLTPGCWNRPADIENVLGIDLARLAGGELENQRSDEVLMFQSTEQRVMVI